VKKQSLGISGLNCITIKLLSIGVNDG